MPTHSIPIFFISAELWTKYLTCTSTEWFRRRNLPWVGGGWPNSTQTKDLSVSAITVIAQFTFWLISGASAEGEYLHYIQDRSWAQLRQHSVYSHLTDCCPRSGLTQLTGRVQRKRNVVQEDLGMELEDWEVKDNEQKRHNFFLKLGVMQLNEWSVKNRVEKEKEKVREEFMIHVVLEF